MFKRCRGRRIPGNKLEQTSLQCQVTKQVVKRGREQRVWQFLEKTIAIARLDGLLDLLADVCISPRHVLDPVDQITTACPILILKINKRVKMISATCLSSQSLGLRDSGRTSERTCRAGSRQPLPGLRLVRVAHLL